MEIRIRETGDVLTEVQFSDLHNTTFAALDEATLDAFGADLVHPGTPPEGAFWQHPVRDGVEQINGKWYTKYVLGPIFTDTTAEDGTVTTAAEHEAAYKAIKDAAQAQAVRDQRNAKLAECDWTQVADSPVDKGVWAVYRQALRDITVQAGFPWDINWPVAPGA